MYEDVLPYTGIGALTVGGIALGLPYYLAIGVGAVLIGVLCIRVATRKTRRAASNKQ